MIFSAKELDDFLEREVDLTKSEEISKLKKAYALLLTLLDDLILALLQKENIACKVWKSFQSMHEAKGAVKKILTQKRLAINEKK